MTTVVSIGVDDDRPLISVRIWRITPDEGVDLAEKLTEWYGSPVNVLAPREVVAAIDSHPGVITDESG
jgi:hypothetical protein